MAVVVSDFRQFWLDIIQNNAVTIRQITAYFLKKLQVEKKAIEIKKNITAERQMWRVSKLSRTDICI